jgi:hypothetical protein
LEILAKEGRTLIQKNPLRRKGLGALLSILSTTQELLCTALGISPTIYIEKISVPEILLALFA